MIEKFAPATSRKRKNAKQAKFLLFQRLLHDDEMVFPREMKDEVKALIKECAEKYGRPPKARIIWK